MNNYNSSKKSSLNAKRLARLQPTSYGALKPQSTVNSMLSSAHNKGEFQKDTNISPDPITLQQGVKSREFTPLKTTRFVEPVMENKRYNTPFAQFLYKDSNGFYNVRLGPKIYMVKISLDYTPDFDSTFFGGAQANDFNWHSILVKEKSNSEPRPINDEELEKSWFKSNVKKLVNYQRAIQRNANTQSTRYSKEQRINYRNSQFNGA
ncbi:hypothetical protein [Acinetobacter sp.]|uniref:hypothetical protein n=1 Tax=Acinetobacter sp. TaxID=472 RepID=UPI003341310E